MLTGEPANYLQRTNRIHEVDLVRTLEAVLEASDPPPVLHAVDSEPATLGDVLRFIASELGVQPPPHAPSGRVSGNVYDGSLLVALVGQLSFPSFRAGYRELLRRSVSADG